MKFLCVPCDSPMKLQAVGPPDRGSLSVVYECPECGYEMAMLTNPFETQLVQSLGVRIGPDSGAGAAAVGGAEAGVDAATGSVAGAAGEAGGRCPFKAMIPAADETNEPGVIASTGADAAERRAPDTVRWTSAAEARLANIPAFVRPMARTGIEKFARDLGASEVDERVLDAAKDFFGM